MYGEIEGHMFHVLTQSLNVVVLLPEISVIAIVTIVIFVVAFS